MYKIALNISLFLAPLCSSAQTAEDYFHGGAQFYIWGENQKATNQIYTGLRKYPDDPLLNGMVGLLKKKEEQKQPQQQSQQNQSEQKQDQSQQKEQPAQQQKAEEEKKQQEQQAAKQSQEQKDQQQAAQAKEKPDEKGQGEPAKAYAAGQMTPQEAQQLLDAQKGEEMMLPVKPTGKPMDRNRPFKDW